VAPASELVRVVRNSAGVLSVGTGLPGRGAWLCRESSGCFELAVKRHAFSKAFRHQVAQDAVEDLRATLSPVSDPTD
jgi:predicted RNA-binding protein YlxR (DUF448 family)